eukprot:gene30120-52212_t
MFLQPRPAVFSAARSTVAGADARAEAAERLMLQNLNALMAADGWRREGLTIGAVARELDAPEHRLRRLINQRLGHRNFADFVNSYRIEAAKTRLGDAREARTTVAAIAFDLGYGSLGPFNRAFRAATGSTPTEWRRQALRTSPEFISVPGETLSLRSGFLGASNAKGAPMDGLFQDIWSMWTSSLTVDLRRYVIFAVAVWAVLWLVLRNPLRARKIRDETPPRGQLLSEF